MHTLQNELLTLNKSINAMADSEVYKMTPLIDQVNVPKTQLAKK